MAPDQLCRTHSHPEQCSEEQSVQRHGNCVATQEWGKQRTHFNYGHPSVCVCVCVCVCCIELCWPGSPCDTLPQCRPHSWHSATWCVIFLSSHRSIPPSAEQLSTFHWPSLIPPDTCRKQTQDNTEIKFCLTQTLVLFPHKASQERENRGKGDRGRGGGSGLCV